MHACVIQKPRQHENNLQIYNFISVLMVAMCWSPRHEMLTVPRVEAHVCEWNLT